MCPRRDQRKTVDGRQPQRGLYVCTVVSTVLIVEKCFIAVAAYIVGGWIGTYVVVAKQGHSASDPTQQ